MKKKLYLPIVVVLAAAVVGASAGSASAAHFSPNGDSVDGRDVRYQDETKWDDSRTWAEARWEELPEDVEMLKDTAFTVADIEIQDYNLADGNCGYRQVRGGSADVDLVALNDNFYNGANSNDRRNCTVHEFGHVFGLGDHTESTYNNIVMDSCPVEACGASYDRPQAHDKVDFTSLWK